MHRWQGFAAIGLGVAAVAIALLPFNRVPSPATPVRARGFLPVSLHCASPVVGAWRRDPPQSGWFGYAPLTGTLMPSAPGPCRGQSRHRLASAGLLGAGAAFLALSGRRRQWASARRQGPRSRFG